MIVTGRQFNMPGSKMKYRTDFVTNSSSSAYVHVTLKTTQKNHYFDINLDGDPGFFMVTPLVGIKHYSQVSYQEVIEYLLNVVRYHKMADDIKNNEVVCLHVSDMPLDASLTDFPVTDYESFRQHPVWEALGLSAKEELSTISETTTNEFEGDMDTNEAFVDLRSMTAKAESVNENEDENEENEEDEEDEEDEEEDEDNDDDNEE